MDTIREMLSVFTNQEVKELQRHVRDTCIPKVAKLLGAYLSNSGSAKAGSDDDQSSVNSFYQSRYKLIRAIEEFIRNTSNNNGELAYVTSIENMVLVQFFFNRKQALLGWKYLKKAEELAINGEEFGLLDRIYHKQIEFAHFRSETEISDLLEKLEQNDEKARLDDQMNISLGKIRSRIRADQQAGKMVDPESIAKEVYRNSNLESSSGNSVAYQTKFGMLLFEVMEHKGDLISCATILIDTFNSLEKKEGYRRHHGYLRGELLTLIAESLVKSQQFKKCEGYLNLLDAQLLEINAPFLKQAKGKFIRFICLVGTNRLIEAGKLLSEVDKNYKHFSTSYDDIYLLRSLTGNWTSFHYFNKNYKESLRHLSIMQNIEKRVNHFFGIRSGIYLNFAELMIRIDLKEHMKYDQITYLQSRVKSIERRYKEVLDDQRNISIVLFLKLLESIISNPEYLKSKRGIHSAETFIGFHRNDIYKAEFLPISPWLQHHMTDEDGYSCFLNGIGYKGE